MSELSEVEKSAEEKESSSTRASYEEHIESNILSEPFCNMELNIHKYSPMNYLLKLIPQKGQRGLSIFDIELTCITSCLEFIVLGSSVGIVYLYNRKKHNIIRLRCEGYIGPITCVEIAKLEDFIVASGTKDGRIFCHKISADYSIQKSFVIRGIHKESINTLAWSQNAEKLFSGDNGGYVVCTVFQYNEDIIPSSCLLIEENYPIIQLAYSYYRLLVGTTERCLFFNSAANNESQQIGRKKRKNLGKYGITFFPLSESFNYVIYSARPNFHVWKCGSDGKVIETIILKDVTKKTASPTQTVKPHHSLLPKNAQLGLLKLYCERYLVSWNETSLIIIDPIDKKIVDYCWDFDNIRDLAICKDEIFLLLKDRNLIRIANHPENVEINLDVQDDTLISIKNQFKQLGNSWKKLLVFPIEKKQFFLKSNQMFNWHPRNKSSSRNIADKISIEESAEVNEKTSINFKTSENEELKNEITNSMEIIHETGIENASVKSDEKNNLKSVTDSTICVKIEDKNSNKDDFLENVHNNQITSTELVDESLNNTDKVFDESYLSNQSTFQIKENLDSENDREPLSLEEILFRYKNCHKENKDTSKFCKMSVNSNVNIKDHISIENKELLFVQKENKSKDLDVNNMNNTSNFKETEEIINQKEIEIRSPVELKTIVTEMKSQFQKQQKATNEEILINNDFKNDNLELKIETNELNHKIQTLSDFCHKIQNFEDDSLIKTFDNNEPKECDSSDSNIILNLSDSEKDMKSNTVINRNLLNYKDIWIQDKAPELLISLAACNQYLYCIDVNRKVWYTSLSEIGFLWIKTTKEANQIAVPANGNAISILNKEIAYIALFSSKERNLSSSNWKIAAEKVAYIAIDDSSFWYINNNGELYVRQYAFLSQSNSKSSHISCNHQLAQVTTQAGNVCVLTTSRKILYRTGITVYKIEGSGWKEIKLMENVIVKTCVIDSKDLLWITDDHCKVWFQHNISKVVTSEINSKWWQIDMSDLLFQDDNQMKMVKDFATSVLLASSIPWNIKFSNLHSCITTSEKGIWYCETPGKIIFSNRKDIIGHYWRKINIEVTEVSSNLKYISAENSTSEKDVIWGLLNNNNILCFSNKNEKPLIIQPPDMHDKTSCLTAAPGVLWILTSLGRIFIMNEISSTKDALEKVCWKELDLSQLANIHLVHITCGKNIVWACDQEGICYFRAGSLTLSSVQPLNQAWIPIDLSAEYEMKVYVQGNSYQTGINSHSGKQIHISKIYAGQNDFMIWAIDKKHNIYVREGIFSDLPIGIGWVYVKGIQAKQLCISSNFVWAVTLNGCIYCRFGITDKNYIGDYWKKIPGNATYLSGTTDGRVYAIGFDEALYQYETYVIKQSSSARFTSIVSTVVEKVQEDWEFI